MKRRNLTILVVVIVAVVMFAWLLISKRKGKREWDDLIRSVTAQIVTAERDNAQLKTDLVQLGSILNSNAVAAEEEAERWGELGKNEEDSQMQQVDFAFRDGFRLHVQAVGVLRQELGNLGLIGEQEESNIKMLELVQSQVERAARVSTEGAPTTEEINRTKNEIVLLQSNLLRLMSESRICRKG